MKLGHHDTTETNHAGIDQRANAVFYAPDKHSIKYYKDGTKKILENKSNYSFLCPVMHRIHQVFIVSTLRSFFISQM